MRHEPTLYSDGPEHYWFECSCGFMGDWRTTMWGASIRWKMHMAGVASEQIREEIAHGPKHAVGL